MMLPTIDKDGFHDGYLDSSFITEQNAEMVVGIELPSDSITELERAKWNGEAWEIAVDYRRGAWYNPEATDEIHSAASWDDAPPPGWLYWSPGTERVVGSSEALARARILKWTAVKAERERQFAAQAVTTNGIVYRITKDEGNLLKLQEIRRAMNAPAEYLSTWVDDNNVAFSLDQEGLNSLTAQMGMRGQAIFVWSWELRTLIESSGLEALDALDITQGWPT